MINGSSSLTQTSKNDGINKRDQKHKQESDSSEKYEEEDAEENELFHADRDGKQKPWWKSNFLITGGVKFGTWDGVFTTCMLNIFGIIIFLRTGWMVGHAGLGLSFLIVFLTMMIAIITVSSAIGVCERCQIESGGVYFLLSHVLGARIGASVGFLYCFGQAVASSLYVMGLGESICNLAGWTNPWIAKGIAATVLLFLLGINLAGVKWVIRVQLLLLFILFISIMDFLLGSFVKQTPKIGVLGYSLETYRQNSAPDFTSDYGFFAVFGVFFPTATGVCSGINMSGDLRNPKTAIPYGTLAAVGVSSFLYLFFVIALGGTCTRSALQTDNMITAKVALLGPLLLFGLYVSSLSAALGGVTTAPKILSVISETTKLPGTTYLSKMWGKNKVPVVSILSIVLISLTFVLIGDINFLGPVVTMPFLLTYGALTYAYFTLAMSFDIRRRREDLYRAIHTSKCFGSAANNGDNDKAGAVENRKNLINGTAVVSKYNDAVSLETKRLMKIENGTLNEKEKLKVEDPNKELDKLFPERKSYGAISSNEEEEPDNPNNLTVDGISKEIIKQPRSFYSIIINRWISLFGSVIFLMLMFMVNWIYALVIFALWIVLYNYVGYMAPGLFPGVSEFSFIQWLSAKLKYRSCRKNSEMLIPPKIPKVSTESSHVTNDSFDFKDRGRYHQTKLIQEDSVTKAIAGED